jgi:hypothetical protein
MIVVLDTLFSVIYVLDEIGLLPWFRAVYMNREYPTVKNLINPIGKTVLIDCLIVPVINKISLIKLILGGAAIFALHARNHHIDDSGIIDINPFVREILRLCLDSYVM